MKSPQRKVSAVRVEDHTELAAGFRRALQQLPGLLPQTLPRLVVIKPNLCDISPWETGVTTDPRWVGILAAELRAIRRDVEIRVSNPMLSAHIKAIAPARKRLSVLDLLQQRTMRM